MSKELELRIEQLEHENRVLRSSLERYEGEHIFTTIVWQKDDVLETMGKKGVEPTDVNYAKVYGSRAPRSLHESSISHGWEALEVIVGDLLYDGLLDKDVPMFHDFKFIDGLIAELEEKIEKKAGM